jgi:hypothetical protein
MVPELRAHSEIQESAAQHSNTASLPCTYTCYYRDRMHFIAHRYRAFCRGIFQLCHRQPCLIDQSQALEKLASRALTATVLAELALPYDSFSLNCGFAKLYFAFEVRLV